jgi:hypothetical protein
VSILISKCCVGILIIGLYIYICRAIKEIRATGDDDVLGNVLKLLGQYRLRIMKKLIKNICKSGGWHKDFIEVKMIALKKKPKLQNAATITQSASSHIQQR